MSGANYPFSVGPIFSMNTNSKLINCTLFWALKANLEKKIEFLDHNDRDVTAAWTHFILSVRYLLSFQTFCHKINRGTSQQNMLRIFSRREIITFAPTDAERTLNPTCCPLPEPYLTSWEWSLTLCFGLTSFKTLPQVIYLNSGRKIKQLHHTF